MKAQRSEFAAVGFHDGELDVQQRAGVRDEASPLAALLAPVQLRGGVVAFLAERTFAVVTARDSAGKLWTSLVTGEAGFLEAEFPTSLNVHATVANGDPLEDAPTGQPVGMVVMDFTTGRRMRVNGTMTRADRDGLVVDVEQAYGNCPQFIQQRTLLPFSATRRALRRQRRDVAPSAADISQVRTADTFFLGTTHPGRGNDASHRGGPAGFVRVDGADLWWPDYPGNNMFNSLGNLVVDPTAALLFINFDTGTTLQLSGTASVEWNHGGEPGDDGGTGRCVHFHTQLLVAGRLSGVRQLNLRSYPHNPALT